MKPTPPAHINHRAVFWRALRCRCPRCGEGRLFSSFYTLHDDCATCRLPFSVADGNTWFFMYMSSGAVIGVCFLILLMWRPARADLLWASAIMMGGALAVLVATLPMRKSLGIAMDYVLEPPPSE